MAQPEDSDLVTNRLIEIGSENLNYVDNKFVSAKYTIWNFLPKNLYAQFRRVANFYFLCVTLLTLFIDSPVGAWASILPLLIVVSVSAIKQAYEDWLRRKSDRIINSVPVKVLQGDKFQIVHSRRIRVGNIVRVDSENDVPCDLILLMSSREDSKCFVTTANLDGETNLKSLECPLRQYVVRNGVEVLKGTIDCEQPTLDLYHFSGEMTVDLLASDVAEYPAEFLEFEKLEVPSSSQSLTMDRYKVSLSASSLVLRGSRLKNTDYIMGCAIYTGRETKLAYNSQKASHKSATSEKSINFFLAFFFALLVLEVLISVIMDYYEASFSETDYYLGEWYGYTLESLFNEFFSYVVLYYYIIPISLYVTIEMQKFIGSLFIKWDSKLVHNDVHAEANTSDLNEDLGQIEYLFSDKTGTLTENVMSFRYFSVGNKVYSENNGEIRLKDEVVTDLPEGAEHLLLSMALCHTVQCSETVESNAKKLPETLPSYEASSADEKALVEAAARCGFVYLGEENNVISLSIKGIIKEYTKLKLIEFTSDRKRMSIICSDVDGEVFLICKGAESSLVPLVTGSSVESAIRSSSDFSKRGLRTLFFGWKKLDENSIKTLREQAEVDEGKLEILGVTAVEDQLQPRVGETLKALSEADVKVWILTGDRLETATAVALSCGHFTPDTKQFQIVNNSFVDLLQDHLREIKNEVDHMTSPFYLVIDGRSLKLTTENEDCTNLFLDISLRAQSVLCCRLAPKQKAQVVRLVKHTKSRPVTAAVGDGGNDVAMILEAHIGIGLIGKEGRQAANNSDFILPTFCGLERLLLVHGHWFYRRLAILVQYFFYKNFVFITPQVFFTIYNGASPQPLYSSIFFLLYNTVFTAVPIVLYSLFEQDYPESELISQPKLYIIQRKNALLSWTNFFLWVLDGVWHSSVIYFFPCILVMKNPEILLQYNPIDLSGFGTIVIHLCVIVVSLKILIESQYQTSIFIGSVILSILIFIGFTMLYNIVDLSLLDPLHGVYTKLIISPTFWFLTVLGVVTCFITDFTIKAIRGTFSLKNMKLRDIFEMTRL